MSGIPGQTSGGVKCFRFFFPRLDSLLARIHRSGVHVYTSMRRNCEICPNLASIYPSKAALKIVGRAGRVAIFFVVVVSVS